MGQKKLGNRPFPYLDKIYGGSLSKKAKVDKRMKLEELKSPEILYLFNTRAAGAYPKAVDVRWVQDTYSWNEGPQNTETELPIAEVRRLCKAESCFAGSSSFMEDLFLEASGNLRLLRKLLKDRELADRLKKEGGVCHVLDCSRHRYVILLWVGKTLSEVGGIVDRLQRTNEVYQAVEEIRKNADILTKWNVSLGQGVKNAINQYWD